MKLWIDDIRPAPEGYAHIHSVDGAKRAITHCEARMNTAADYKVYNRYSIEVIDIDHDAGNFACDGGDYIRLLDWLEETGRNYPIRIHSQNPVGVENMRRIIERNGWKEIR